MTSGESNPATSREVGADCLFTLNSLRKTKVSNVRERQRLELRLRILDSEERFETSKINIFSKSVRKRLDVLQSRMTEYNKRRESQLKLLGGAGDGKESVESTRRKSLALKVMKMEDEVIPSLKKLIAFAMKNPEEEPEEDGDGSGNNTIQESGGDGTRDRDEPDAAEVRGSYETDQGTPFGTDDLKALVDRLYENFEREYETDAIVKRLRPIISRQAEAAAVSTPAGAAAVVATTMAGKSQTMNQLQQPQQPPQQLQQPQQQITNVGFSFFQELSLNEDDGIVTLNKILSLEFPETSIQQQIEKKAALRARDREKKLWEKFTPKPIALPPIHMLEKPKLIPRFWDYDIQPQVIQQVTPEDWEELKFCHYLRNSMPDFKIDSPI